MLTGPVRLYAAVGLGSGLGAAARLACSLAMLGALGPAFPWGTLAVNLAGSFAIGLYATLSGPGGRIAPSHATRQFVVAGLCGGFTTFSIFSLETLHLAGQGRGGLAALYVATSLTLWLGAAWCGHAVACRLNRVCR